MKEESIRPLMDSNSWYYVRLKKGFHYKARLVELNNNSLTIIDRFGLSSVFDVDSIESISAWRGNEDKRGSDALW